MQVWQHPGSGALVCFVVVFLCFFCVGLFFGVVLGFCVVLWFGLLVVFQNLLSPANVHDMVLHCKYIFSSKECLPLVQSWTSFSITGNIVPLSPVSPVSPAKGCRVVAVGLFLWFLGLYFVFVSVLFSLCLSSLCFLHPGMHALPAFQRPVGHHHFSMQRCQAAKCMLKLLGQFCRKQNRVFMWI